MQSRTDLAVEQVEQLEKAAAGVQQPRKGIHIKKRGRSFRITEIIIESDQDGAAVGRGKGRYLTLENRTLHHAEPLLEDEVCELAEELRQFIPVGTALVAGLGNAEITPDALGPETAGRILATRHLRKELAESDPDTSFLRELRQVAVLANGVLGQTGIETAELLRALRKTIQPASVIAVDALACSDIRRLGTTVQISDAGIAPGSGVQNRRAELSEKTLGIPVIAVGVPTVMDLHTIAAQAAGNAPKNALQLPNMMVTPRDIDRLLHRASRLIAAALNMALHPQLSFADAEAL